MRDNPMGWLRQGSPIQLSKYITAAMSSGFSTKRHLTHTTSSSLTFPCSRPLKLPLSFPPLLNVEYCDQGDPPPGFWAGGSRTGVGGWGSAGLAFEVFPVTGEGGFVCTDVQCSWCSCSRTQVVSRDCTIFQSNRPLTHSHCRYY